MIFLALMRDALSFLGFVYVITIVWKMARHYPVRRWLG